MLNKSVRALKITCNYNKYCIGRMNNVEMFNIDKNNWVGPL